MSSLNITVNNCINVIDYSSFNQYGGDYGGSMYGGRIILRTVNLTPVYGTEVIV